jgi:cytochrome c55X
MNLQGFLSLARGFGPVLFLCFAVSPPAEADTAKPIPSADRQAELIRLVRDDCGSCHGLTLKGGLGTPLTPDAIGSKPDMLLRETILRGRTGTAMPGWSDFMNESEAQWIVDQLKTGFPNAR